MPRKPRTGTRGRIRLTLGLVFGLGVAAVLAARAGWPAVLEVMGRLGWAELAAICLLQLGATVLCGAGWRIFAPGTSLLACTAARAIRDGTSSILAILPGLGEIAGIRALVLFGAAAPLAAASGIVDLATEVLSQCLFTIAGILALIGLLGSGSLVQGGASVAVAAATTAALGYLVGSERGRLGTERLLARAARAFGPAAGRLGTEFAHHIAILSADRVRVAAATLVHLAAWFLGAAQIWAAAAALDHPLSPLAALALASLVHAARGIFFVVPWGAGIQEAGFVVAGALLGLDEPTALALSLVMRVRDLILGLPALAGWALAEAGQTWRKARRAALRGASRTG